MGLFQPEAQVKGDPAFNFIALICSSFSATAFSFVMMRM
jgi:hypothetical protein